jgi:hypothetical protein
MRIGLGTIICFTIILSMAGFSGSKLDYRAAKKKNVCKELRGDILVYFIFVDNKETQPWSEFDIRTTIDSMNVAVRWLEQMAHKKNINLRIKSDYFIGSNFTPIKKNLPQGTIWKTIDENGLKAGLQELNSWADYIAKKAGSTFNITEKDGIPDPGKPKNKERLIAYLRDEYKVESVALLYLLNNYYKTDISISVNTYNTDDVEFSVVSYKYPSEIAHSILHLYGAADLYKTPYRRNEKKIKYAEKAYSSDIMQDPYGKDINTCTIGSFTQFLIGWTDKQSNADDELFIEKAVRL